MTDALGFDPRTGDPLYKHWCALLSFPMKAPTTRLLRSALLLNPRSYAYYAQHTMCSADKYYTNNDLIISQSSPIRPFLITRDAATGHSYGLLYDNGPAATFDLGCEHSNYYGRRAEENARVYCSFAPQQHVRRHVYAKPTNRYRTYESFGDLDYYLIFGPRIRCGRSRDHRIGVSRLRLVGWDEEKAFHLRRPPAQQHPIVT